MTGEIDPVRVVNDAIENGISVGRITDQLVPFVHWDLAGDNRRSATIAFFEDFEKVVAGCSIERFKPPIIEDKQLHTADCPQEACITTIAARECKIGEQLGNALVENDRLSRQALWPRADASQLLPIPVGPHRIKFSCASIQPPAVSFWNSARSRPRAAR